MSEHLSEKEIAAYKEAFSLFDQNCDGTVTMSELSSIMRTIGINPSDQQLLQEMIDDADQDDNGTVQFAEFLHMMSKAKNNMEETTDKEIFQAFCVFDKDGSGYIEDDELRMILESLGKGSVTQEDIDDFLSAVDLDGDGRINYDEFYQMMLKNK